jgi:hypothetical protein
MTKKQKQYEVVQQLAGANIKGGVLLPGRIITRDDLPAASDAKWEHLIKDGWIVEVKDDGKIPTE